MGHRISPARVFLSVGLVFLALTGTASAYQFTFATPIPRQQQAQRAISFQLNRQVARHWVIDPVSFTATGGIPIVIVPDARIPCRTAAAGCHVWDGQQITIYVTQGSWDQESSAVSHEIIETEIDPHAGRYVNGRLLEACDPVDGGGSDSEYTYRLFGVWVSDFTYPRYWYGGGHGHRYDRESMLHGPPAGAPSA